MPVAGGNTISFGDLQQQFANNPGDFNDLGTGGVVSVDPNSTLGQSIITAWNAASNPGDLTFFGGRRPVVVRNGTAVLSASATSISQILVLAVVGIFLLIVLS